MNAGNLDRPALLYPLLADAGMESGTPRRAFGAMIPLWVGMEKTAGNLPAEQAGARRASRVMAYRARRHASLTAGARMVVDGQNYEISDVSDHPKEPRALVLLECRASAGAIPVSQ